MHSPRFHTRFAALAALIALVAGACSKSTPSGAPTPTGAAALTAITTAWPADVTSLDPANDSTNQDHTLNRNIYETLLSTKFAEQSDGTLKFVGANVTADLAQSWDLGPDSVTFHLRPGVTFYGTTDTVTAEDVKWSLGRVWSTPGVGDFQANGLQKPDQIQIVDPLTVKINFVDSKGAPTPPTPTLLAIFDQFYTSIADENLVKPHETADDPTGAKWLRSNAAGTGPYYIADRKPGVSLTLKAVPNHWASAPSYQTVNIQISTASISSLLQSGQVTIGESGMTNAQVNALAKAGLTVDWQNTGNFDMFAITAAPAAQVGPLANPNVRQAIAYVMPYDQILNNVVFGRGARDLSIVSPSAPEYSPAWSMYTTNLDKAKQLMAAAGNPAINMPLHFLQGDEDQKNTALLIQNALKALGITTMLTPETQSGLFDVLDARSTPAAGAQIGPPGMELFNWSAWTDDPKIVIGYWATTGGINNYTLWSDPSVDATNTKYALLPTSADRTAAYQAAQKTIAEGAAMIPIVQTGFVTVVAKGISGVSFSPGGSGRYWTLHPAGTKSALDAMFE
jgi:peptide/nickel transport system substrate-binding protein